MEAIKDKSMEMQPKYKILKLPLAGMFQNMV